MNLYIITIITIALPVIATVIMTGRYRRRSANVNRDNILTEAPEEWIKTVTATCNGIICNALKCVTENNTTEACRNHRQATQTIRDLHKKSGGPKSNEIAGAPYLTYMMEAAEKIAETSRHIVTSPDNASIALCHSDILTLCKNLGEKTNADDNIANALANKERLERMIAIHTKAMNYEDFNEGSPVYSGLILLYYLHSFINSYYRVISTSSQSPRLL